MESEIESKTLPDLDPKRIAKSDPLLKSLLKIKTSPVLIGISYSLIFNMLRLLAAWYTGTLRTSATITGFFDDPSMYINLVLGAVVWTYYIWMPQGVASTFRGLFANKAIGSPISKITVKRGTYSREVFARELQRSFGRWWWSVTSLILSIGGVALFLFPGYLARMEIKDSWSMADPLNLALSSVWALIGLYAVLLLLIYITLSIYWLHRLFTDFTVYVRPLHPDNAGGLSPLGRFSLSLSYIITFLGLILVIIPLTRHYLVYGTFRFEWTRDVLIGMAAYVIAAPFAFFAPLSVAHNAMKNAKSGLLLKIAQRFETEYTEGHQALDADPLDLEERLKRLKELQSLHEMTSKFPVWPFNIENIARFATSFFSPIVLALITNLLSRFSKP